MSQQQDLPAGPKYEEIEVLQRQIDALRAENDALKVTLAEGLKERLDYTKERTMHLVLENLNGTLSDDDSMTALLGLLRLE